MSAELLFARETLHRGRNAVFIVFTANGFAIASWTSRIPEAREALGLSPGQLGNLLLALSAGALLALPLAGALVQRFGAVNTIVGGAVLAAAGFGLSGLAAGTAGSIWLTATGLFALGLGSGAWDVAMNIEGAAIERAQGCTIMPRFHAAFSLGTVAGAGLGAVAAANNVPVEIHLPTTALLVATVIMWSKQLFLTAETTGDEHTKRQPGQTWRAWLETRTLIIGLMVLTMAFTEGTANDWLAVSLVDGYGMQPWAGAFGFAVFLTGMTTGRIAGVRLLDRFGRLRVLWATMALSGAGVLTVVFAGWPQLALAGTLLWGLGASLGFPVGMSAAADDPGKAPARVGVVSTIGYLAFLAGPPLIGQIGDRVGTLHALLAVGALLVPATFFVPAARPMT